MEGLTLSEVQDKEEYLKSNSDRISQVNQAVSDAIEESLFSEPVISFLTRVVLDRMSYHLEDIRREGEATLQKVTPEFLKKQLAVYPESFLEEIMAHLEIE